MMKNLFLLCGAPGSGKSTWLRNHCKENQIVSRDAIRFNLVKEDEPYFSREDEVFNQYIAKIQELLDDDTFTADIYCDATHLNEQSRNKVLDRLRLKNVFNIYCVVIRPSLEETLRRNALRTGRAKVPDNVIRRMYKSYTDPKYDKKYVITPIYAEVEQKEEPRVEHKIWVTSDTHFNHDREFLFKPRGFNTVEEMNETIIEHWNNVVAPADDVYLLGDVMLGDSDKGCECVRRLNGNIHIILGNHDTDNRVKLYYSLPNVVEVALAAKLKYNSYHFFMTHYPCITSNLEKESLKQCTCNLYGHTHQQTNFYNDIPFIYHVGCDSHNCTPVLLDDIIKDMNDKVKECKEYL